MHFTAFPLLDPVTLLFSICLLSFLMAMVSFTTAGSMPEQAPALREFSKSMSVAGCAFLLYYLRGNISWFLGFFVSNALFLMSSYFGLTAYARLLRLNLSTPIVAGLVVFGVSGVAATYFFQTPRQVAVFTVSAAITVMWSINVALIASGMTKRPTPSALLGIVIFAIGAVAFAARTIFCIAGEGASISPTSGAFLQVGLLLFGAVFIAASAVTFLAAAHERQRSGIEENALRDGLTGLYNRAALFRIARELDATRDATRYAVVMLDIDYFKDINDRHGHSGGDVVLAQAAALIASLARKADAVFRYGGEEFCVLLYDSGQQEAEHFSARVVVAAGRSVANLPDGSIVPFTFSAGYATRSTATTHGAARELFASVLERADLALYRAKRGGRNQSVAALPVVAIT